VGIGFVKIAFCLSGGPRFQHRGLFKLIDAIKGFDEADFFIRTWKTEEYGTTAEEFENWLRQNSEGTLDKCNFRVTHVLDDDATNAPPRRGLYLNIAPWAPNFITMWWGIVESHRLFKEYAEQTGEQYDLVFRMRTDMLPDSDIDLATYTDKNKMYNAKNFGDNFLFGTPETYQKYVDYYNIYLPTLSSNPNVIHPEESLRTYFEKYNIAYECVSAVVQPYWDKGEYKGRFRPDHV
jgi:hypothetical protein